MRARRCRDLPVADARGSRGSRGRCVLSIYPLTTDIRSAARMVETQADDPARATQLVVLGGASYLQNLQHEQPPSIP